MMKKNKEIVKVLIVDNHHFLINGLKTLLSSEKDMIIVNTVSTGKEALEVFTSEEIDIVLSEIFLSDMMIVELIKKTAEFFPATHIIALTMHNDNTLVAEVIEAGAQGYVLKSAGITELCDAIYSVAEGGKYLSKEVQDVIMNNIYNQKTFLRNNSKAIYLTPREQEVLDLLVKRISNDEIAKKLLIAESTFEAHRRSIFAKTKTNTLNGLIKFAKQYSLNKG